MADDPKLTTRAPARVPVIDSYGRWGTMAPDEAAQAIRAGDARYPEAHEIQAQADHEQYGTGILNPALAAGESAASLATLGLSRHLENASGLTTPEAQAARARENPVASNLVGPAVGIGGLILGSMTGASEGAGAVGAGAQAAGLGAADLVPGNLVMRAGQAVARAAAPAAQAGADLLANPAARPIVNKILARAGSAAIGSAAEGAFFGLGQSVDEKALGDPDAMGEKLLPHLGWGALIGGTAGGIFGGIQGGLQGRGFAAAKEVPSTVEPAGAPGADPAVGAGAPPDSSGPAGAPPTGLAPGPDAPGSLAEIQDRVKNATYQGFKTELPQKAELEAAVGAVPDLEFKPHNVQMASLDNQGARDVYKAGLEMPTKEAQAMRDYEAIQKQETLGKTQSTIGSVAGKGLTDDPVQAGNRIIKAFTEQHEAEKKAVAPIFQKFNDAGIVPTDPWEVIGKVEDAIPGAKKYLNVGDDGAFEIAPYQDKMPFSKAVWGDLQKVVRAANDKELTLGDLRNVRNNLGDHIRFDSPMPDKIQSSALKKGLMDYMQDSVQKLEPDLELRDAFRRYAINQEKRATIEYTLGGSIGEGSGLKRQIVPEDVLKNLFSDTPTVKAARDILGKDTFNEALGNYLNTKVASVTDKGAFSSNKFGTFLRQKWPELEEAFRESPGSLKRLKALNDIMRILPDSASVNPSGTAKTLSMMGMLHKVGGLVAHPFSAPMKLAGEGMQAFAEREERAQTYAQLNALLAGKSPEEAAQVGRMADFAGKVMGATPSGGADRATQMGKMERAVQATTKLIQGGAKAIFGGPKPGTVPVATTLMKPAEHDKIADHLTAMSSSPEKLMNNLDQSTRGLYHVAPQTAGAVQGAAVRATQFLNSKLPVLPPQKPFGPKLKPSKGEISKFGRYHAAVSSPTSVLADVKEGMLTPESMEALSAVYPKLLSEMQSTVMEHLTNHLEKKDPKPIPYKTRLALSQFLGQDLDHSTEQADIASNQLALAQMGGSSQGGPPGAPHARPGAVGKMTGAKAMLTASQATAQRNEA